MRIIFFLFLLSSCSHHVNISPVTGNGSRKDHESKNPKTMVTTQGVMTTKAALEIFKNGGNIIDAFVAASFAISVERPHSTGLGGGGFLLYYSKNENKTFAFDFRESAPLRATSKMYLTKDGNPQPLLSQEGALAVATPGLVRGLYEIHQKFGKLPWKEVLQPSIRLAEEGFPLYPQLKEALEDRKTLLHSDPEAKKTFYTTSGETPSLGAIIIQENLARTLEIISETGDKDFYQGEIAKKIAHTVTSQRGLLTLKDLKAYKMIPRNPVVSNYKGFSIFSMPPPSSGGIHVIQILKMLENFDLKAMGPQSTDAVELTAKAMQRAFVDRATYLGDPDFHLVPTEKLISDSYVKLLAQSMNTKGAIPSQKLSPIPFPKESDDTTHFTIADQEGNLVASTQTINGWFGSGVIAQGTGIILNNEMDDFAQKVGVQNLFGAMGGEHNLVEAKKRPLSSMSPTIITKEGSPFMALGSPSGTRIITCVAQTILNTIEFEMPLYEAVAATRIHHQWWPDKLKIESPFLKPEVEDELKKRGFDVVHERLGCSIQAILKTKEGWVGVSDPRGEGLALGSL